MNDHEQNDVFMYRYRAAPPTVFKEALRQRLHERERTPSVMLFLNRHPIQRMATVGIAALLLAAMLTLMVSPDARSAIARGVYQLIGGVRFKEVPPESVWPDGPSPDTGDDGPSPGVYEETVSVAEAQNRLDFALPTRLPEGTSPASNAVISYFTFGTEDVEDDITFARLFYDGPASIMLQVNDQPETEWLVGEDTDFREVEIEGQTVAVYHGSWNVNEGRYTGSDILNVMWTDNNLTYQIQAHGSYSEKDILDMARSILEQ
jgi:hypothetical protein